MLGDVTSRSLRNLGVKRIKTIQEMPMEVMEKVFGKNGIVMWKKANGIDNSPVVQYHERKSISTERTFDKDTIDVKKLEGLITAMAENLVFQLRRGNKLTACITIQIRYTDFQTYTLQKQIPYCASDHVIIPIAIELFRKIYNRRMLVRLIGVRFSHLVEGGHQINLFDDAHIINLYQAMDKIREQYGDRAIMKAAGMEAKSIARWNPFNGEPPPLLANRRV